MLPAILDRAGPLPASHPRDREPLVAGQIYVAPPDRHLLLHANSIRVTRGPWENGYRPSIDALFRSAARWYGPRVIAVVLSGALDDGAAGVAAVQEHGGMVLVQDPREAEVPDMPVRAIERADSASVLPVSEIAQAINASVARAVPPVPPPPGSYEIAELDVQQGVRREPEDLAGVPAGLVCPDCSGALFEIDDATVLRFRCRVGHAWTAEALGGAHGRMLEEALWTAVRILEDDQQVQSRNRAADQMVTRQSQREDAIKLLRSALSEVVPIAPAEDELEAEEEAEFHGDAS